MRESLDTLKVDIKVALERGFNIWARDKLELVHYLLWEVHKEKVDASNLAPDDLTGGEGDLYAVIKPLGRFKQGDMVLPKKEIAFALFAEGYIRPALPGEALRYLIEKADYPNGYLLSGAFYAFMYPNYPELPQRVEEKVKQLLKDFEEAYEKGAFNRCREILSKARYLVWYDLEDLERDVRRGRI